MGDDGKRLPDGLAPANDNAWTPGEAEGSEDIAPRRKLDRVVFDIARLIGRQMARQDFERLRRAAANDNKSRIAGIGGSEDDKH
jgi:hypothetical protein